MTTWEERMAERAALEREAEEAERAAQWAALAAQGPSHPAVLNHLAQMEMTAEQARRIRDNPSDIGCACPGPPPHLRSIPGAPCYCKLTLMRIEQLLDEGPG